VSAVCYLYGVVPAGTQIARAPAGIDEKPVELVGASAAPHAALVTRISGETYSPEKVAALTGNLEWVRDRAQAHDRVLNWASDTARVIPLPMWTFFRDAPAVEAMLAARAAEFTAAFSRVGSAREYTVRAFVRFADLQNQLGELSEDFRALEAQAKAASPGQRYLLERKMEKERKELARRLMRQVAADVHAALTAAAGDAVRDEIAPGIAASEQGQAILSASYLVTPKLMVEFRKTLTEFVDRYRESGFTFAFTGPWPPYHFVGAKAGGATGG